MSQGNLTSTEKDYDVAIRGEGFFRIRMPDGRTAYTRDGSFDLDGQGQIVTRDGYLVEPGITVPQNANGVTISAQGQVQATHPRPDARRRSRPDPARPLRQQGRPRIDRRQPVPRDARRRARPIDGTPGTEGFGNLQQAYLEEGNVNAVTEISSLIAAQRAYEMNSKVITAADQMLSSTTQMFRG